MKVDWVEGVEESRRGHYDQASGIDSLAVQENRQVYTQCSLCVAMQWAWGTYCVREPICTRNTTGVLCTDRMGILTLRDSSPGLKVTGD